MRGSQAQAIISEDYVSYRRHQFIEVLDESGLAQARQAFMRYRREGVITEGEFACDVWRMTDEVRMYRFDFGINEKVYANGAGRWSSLSGQEFSECLKSYTVLCMGRYALSTLYGFIPSVRRIACMDLDGVRGMRPHDIQAQMLDFLGMAGGMDPAMDIIAELLTEKYESASWETSDSRALAGFGDYFIFDREQKKFWDRAGDTEKTEAFPVWLWWNLTAVLPLRPTEFLTMPWDCVARDENGYVLTVRRTLQKKGSHRYRYHVEDDYGRYQYHIPEKLAVEILSYQAATEPLREPGYWALFLPARKNGLGYMTYRELGQCLEDFLCRIGQPGLSIRLGDTRHLAMISLILSGGSPEICRELAGHEDIDISSNYYANISTLIESAVYDCSRHAGHGAMFEGAAASPIVHPENSIKTRDGWCSYPAAWEGDIGECLKNFRSRGQLGECLGCVHFRADGLPLRLKIQDSHEAEVSENAAFLVRTVEAVRQSKGEKEDIDAAIARLQASGYAYAACLWREFQEEDHGKAKKE